MKNIQGVHPRKEIMTEIWWKLIIFGMQLIQMPRKKTGWTQKIMKDP